MVGKSIRVAAISAVLSALAGCATGPTISPPPPRSVDVQKDYQLLATPRDLKLDVGYPPDLVRQSFIWTDKDRVWRMQFFSDRYAYASIVFRNALNLTNAFEKASLHFQMKPSALATHLSIALVDDTFTTGHVAVDAPLATRVPKGKADDDFAAVSIPLRDFGLHGRILYVPGMSNMASSTRFDWTDVRQIRVNAVNVPRREIIIRNMHIDF